MNYSSIFIILKMKREMILMFSLKEKFKFSDDGIDFLFYNDVPKLSTVNGRLY